MDHGLLLQFKDVGLASILALSAAGSAAGAGFAGMAAIGGWKKCYAQNKAAPFILLAFVGAPLSQTIYGMLLMNKIAQVAATTGQFFGMTGIVGGVAIGLSAYFQGKAGAAAADALAETGKGTSNYLMVLGIIETVAIFVLVFLLGTIKG